MSLALKTLVNGCENECVSSNDRGFQYGDGLFETFAIKNGLPLLWDLHLQRLQRGGELLKISIPSPALLHEEANNLCRNMEQGVLKLIITRGIAGRGYRFDFAEPKPTRVFYLWPFPTYPTEFVHAGVSVCICQQRLSFNKGIAGIKHLNRLEQVLARNEWGEEYAEGLMLDEQDHIIEGTTTNLFMVKDGVLLTPDLSQTGVAGVMREAVFVCAQEMGIAVHTQAITSRALDSADEIFLTNSIIGIWPVKNINAKRYQIGAVTLAIQKYIIAKGLTCVY